MKKIWLALIVVSFMFSQIALPVLAIEGTATIKTSDIYSLAGRKTYRLGLLAGALLPTDNINLNKNSNFNFGLEFDAKLNENLDTGPRFGVVSKALSTSSTNAEYIALKFGYGARIYMFYWGEYASTHGFANLYLNGEVDYFIANKTLDQSSLTNPSSFAGLGCYGSIGVEFAFGPNTGVFLEGGYQRTSVRSSDNQKLPLDGFIVNLGTRLAFF